jgi:hypothetical protein
MRQKTNFFLSLLILLLTVLLTACGETPTATPQPAPPATSTVIAAATTARATTAAPERTTSAASTTRSPTTRAASATTRAATTAAVADAPSLTEKLPERTVIRTFTDMDGRSVKLTYGRGNGGRGDYGWAHIYGKHVEGIWYDGGTITTFPQKLGTKTPAEVLELVRKSVEQDNNPDNQDNNRRGYVYQVPNTSQDVFTVVGSDGTIITSYPVRRGSKDEDA